MSVDRIAPATALLSSALSAPVAGFAPLWFRSEIIGGVGPEWLGRLDRKLFQVGEEGSPATPVVRVRGVDRRAESGLVPMETLERWIAEWAARLFAEGLLPGYRGETIWIYGAAETEPLLRIERGLLRPLGMMLRSVQVNVHVLERERLHLWIAKRAASKAVDPGRFDTLVGGGVTADETPVATMIRECREEAGIDRSLARRAVPAGVVDSIASVRDGMTTVLHRERLTLYDLAVPASFQPVSVDGESETIERLDADAALRSISGGSWTREGAWATSDLIRRKRRG